MKPHVTDEDIAQLTAASHGNKLAVDYTTFDHVLTDLRLLHELEKQEAKIEMVAAKYLIHARAIFGNGGWDIEVGWWGEATVAIVQIMQNRGSLRWPTRRECDDSILAAVAAYEKKEGVKL